MWMLLIVFSVHNDGASHAHSVQLGPYIDEESCEIAARGISEPVRKVGENNVDRSAFCISVQN